MKNNCIGKGECLIQDQDGNCIGIKHDNVDCVHNCEPIKCPNYNICNNLRSEQLLKSFGNVCYECHMFFGKWRGWNNILKQDIIEECKNCSETKLCVLNEKNKNYLCVDCFKKLYFP